MWESVTFRSDLVSGNEYVDQVRAAYFPGGLGDKAMIILHGFRAEKGSFFRAGHILNERGVSSFHLDLPYHGERGISGQGYLERAFTKEQVVLMLNQAWADVKKSVDWLESQGHKNIGIAGYSLGGILTLLAMGREPRMKCGVAVCAGGDLANIILTSPTSRGISERLKADGVGYECLSEALKDVEPCNYANTLPAERLMMVNGMVDRIVTPSNTLKFIARLKSSPKVQWQNTNHFSWKLDHTVLDHIFKFL